MTYKEGEFTAWTDMAVEQEVADFLYGLVRMMKPNLVLETGTGEAYASLSICKALIDNRKGDLWTVEPEKYWREKAEKTLEDYPVRVFSSVGQATALVGKVDFVFLDSGPAYRNEEIAFWLNQQVETLVIHDAPRYDLPMDSAIMLPGRGLWVRLSR